MKTDIHDGVPSGNGLDMHLRLINEKYDELGSDTILAKKPSPITMHILHTWVNWARSYAGINNIL